MVPAKLPAGTHAVDAGFKVVEIHAAHGYLPHEFLSPLSNTRTDGYGGSFEGRTRFAVEVVRAVREAVGEDIPVFGRISASDWTEGGLTVDDSVEIAARVLAEAGADLIDVSSGGNVPHAKITTGPGYQVAFAAIKRKADLVLVVRELLRDPYWALRAAAEVGDSAAVPAQYGSVSY